MLITRVISGTIILVKDDQVRSYLSFAWPWPEAVSAPQACLMLGADQDIMILYVTDKSSTQKVNNNNSN